METATKLNLLFDFTDALRQGKFDESLNEIYTSVVERRKVCRQINELDKFSVFSVGDKVRFNDSIRPRYLKGETAKIVKKNQKTVVVVMDRQDFPRWRGRITCPVSLLEKV